MVAPISAGESQITAPASASAAFFDAAVPVLPAMIAPAWPMRRPGGAVLPAMKAMTGLLHVRLDVLRGLLLGRAADLADQDDRVRVGVVVEHLEHLALRSCR